MNSSLLLNTQYAHPLGCGFTLISFPPYSLWPLAVVVTYPAGRALSLTNNFAFYVFLSFFLPSKMVRLSYILPAFLAASGVAHAAAANKTPNKFAKGTLLVELEDDEVCTFTVAIAFFFF